jgi:hypothetical protein
VRKVIFVFYLFLSLSIFGNNKDKFYAYYTKINTGADWENYSKTDKYTDLVVQLGNGKIVFHRSSSYLPYWQTEEGKWYFEEISSRSGDGPKERPDKNNIYSYVRLISNNDDSIVVHWRYFPNFKLGNHCEPIGGNVGFDGVVHEYFTFYPDGKTRRVIREGAASLDDWNDKRNRHIQNINLTDNGIEIQSTIEPRLSRLPSVKLEGTKLSKSGIDDETSAHWRFDEGLEALPYESRNITIESVSGKEFDIAGHKTVWKKGVSGTALAFDGYYTKAENAGFHLPEYDVGFTVEAWVAPGAYSICRWTGIVHQSEWEADIRENIFQERNWGKMQLGEKLKNGWFLGIDEYGRAVLIIDVGTEIVTLTSVNSIPLYEWSQVAFTYVDEGYLYLYVNGEVTEFATFSGHLVKADKGILIGRNDESIGYVSQHVVRTYSTFPSPLGFEGLIDEVKIYPQIVGHDDLAHAYKSMKPENPAADMQPRTLPGNTGFAESFGAYYTNLAYHDLWDNMWREPDHPDIVVKFDSMPASVVFWRGNRSPGWVTETNKWISDQSTELTDWHWDNKSEGTESCCEHMSDYQARHSHVRLIENTNARVVVHWRYASVDVLYKHPNTCRNEGGWGIWTDEYLTIYPDGVGVRYVEQHGDLDYYHDPAGLPIGFHDTQFLSEAGTKPEDNIHLQSLTIVSHEDGVTELDWSERHPQGLFDAQAIWINLKSDYKVFEVFPPGTNINVWTGEEKLTYSKYAAWNHYPATQAPCDGRFCVAPDRLAHSALGAADNITETGGVLLYGFTNNNAESLIPLARSWNYAPEITDADGIKNSEYDKSERAYKLTAEKNEISFTLNGTEKSQIYNPCFVISGWDTKADVKVDGNNVECRQGLIRNSEGKLVLVVWVPYESQEKVNVLLTKK